MNLVGACMQAGAGDVLRLPASTARLQNAVDAILARHSSSRRLQCQRLPPPPAFAHIQTISHAMRACFEYVEAVAGSRQPLLITGETGVGKELLAQAAHQASGCPGRFIAINAAGLEDSVFSDTLFGHSPGAYTGADQHRLGLIEQAAEGTLFLDEIGDLSPIVQIKLLRLLQEHEYYPLGADKPRHSSARIIASTNCDLSARMCAAQFRDDLYFRLCTHHVHIPPLRQRPEDIPRLLAHFFAEATGASGQARPLEPPPELVPLLISHSFPGNVRELRAMVYDAVSRQSHGAIGLAPFWEAMQASQPLSEPKPAHHISEILRCARHLPSLKESSELLVKEAMRRCGGKQAAAARLLGISRQALNRRLQQQHNDNSN